MKEKGKKKKEKEKRKKRKKERERKPHATENPAPAKSGMQRQSGGQGLTCGWHSRTGGCGQSTKKP